MTVRSGQVHLSEERPVLIVPPSVAGGRVNLVNHGDSTCYLGDITVSATTGKRLMKDQDLVLVVGPGESIYGACASGEKCDVSYLETQLPEA